MEILEKMVCLGILLALLVFIPFDLLNLGWFPMLCLENGMLFTCSALGGVWSEMEKSGVVVEGVKQD